MLNGLYSAASALNTNFQTQDIVAHNLAHVNVPGFKRVLASVGIPTDNQPENQIPVQSNAGVSAKNINGVRIHSQTFDFTQGQVIETGIPLNVAIDGDGFFEVESDGRTFYSRNGEFTLSLDGNLSLSSGQIVQGEGGPINIPTNVPANAIEITSDGTVYGGGQQLGKIKLVDFDDRRVLNQVGTTLFEASPDAEPQQATARIQQYHLESSNAQAVTELIQMISGMRHFEAAQKALTSISETLQRHANLNQS